MNTNNGPSSLIKPNLETPFNINFVWWKQSDKEWRTYLQNLLCEEHQDSYLDSKTEKLVDWVDLQSAEVKKVDAMQHTLFSHCTQLEDFVTPHTAIIEAIFRIFMRNGNKPLNVNQIAEKLNREPGPILRSLSGAKAYRGIRPISR